MRRKSFFIYLIFLFCVFGCGDEGVLLEGLVPSAPVSLQGIRPVPEDIQAILWGKDVDTLMAELEDAIDGEYTTEDGKIVNDPTRIHSRSLIHQMCLRREQEAYYEKYISAGGVAIMGNGYIDDRFFYAARDIVLGMTSKRPELRQMLSPSRENRPGATQRDGRHDVTGRTTPSRKYRMILVHGHQGNLGVPEVRLGNGTFHFPVLSIGSSGTYGRVVVQMDPSDPSGHRLFFSRIFIHEFAHAIHTAIELLDTTFDVRLEAAYAATKRNGSYFGEVGSKHYALKTKWEYWAESAEVWFGIIAKNSLRGMEHTRDLFRERDPLMYDLLTEWFDLIYLYEVDSRVYNRLHL